MPIIKSAKKRVRTAQKAATRNSKTKRSLKLAIKNLQAALNGDNKKAHAALAQVHSTLDKAVKKGVIHKNNAARKKKHLAATLKKSGVKTPVKKVAKKAPAKNIAKKRAISKK